MSTNDTKKTRQWFQLATVAVGLLASALVWRVMSAYRVTNPWPATGRPRTRSTEPSGRVR